MTLRNQLRELGTRIFNVFWAEKMLDGNEGKMIQHLAAEAFLKSWPEGNDTHLIRAAHAVWDSQGAIYIWEPGIMFE